MASRFPCKISGSIRVLRVVVSLDVHPHCDEFARLKQGAGWDNARAARELGLHPTVIWKYMTGKTHPSLTVLRLLAGLTSQPLLLDGEPTMKFHDGPRWLEDWESDVVAVLRRLEPAARKRVISAVREIIEATAAPIRYQPPKPASADPIPSPQQIAEAMSRDLISPPAPGPAKSGASAGPVDGPPLPSEVSAGSAPSPGHGRGRGTSRKPSKRSGDGTQIH